MSNVIVLFCRLPHGAGLPQPSYAHPDDAGMDLHAALTGVFPPTRVPFLLLPSHRVLIPTGFRIALPSGTQGEIRGRSGLAVQHGIGITQGVGTLDAGYRGEVKVSLINHSDKPFIIDHGDRIAQLVIMPVLKASVHEAPELPSSDRGAGGFGSTGVC